jgi:hypothetical protein
MASEDDYWPEPLVIELKKLVRAEKFNFDKVSLKLSAYSNGKYNDIDLTSKACRLAYARDYSNAPYDLSASTQSTSPGNAQMTKAQRLKLTLERQEQERKAVALQRQILEQQEEQDKDTGDIAPFDFSQVDAAPTTNKISNNNKEQKGEESVFAGSGASDIVRKALAAMTSEEKVDLDALFPQRGSVTVKSETWKEEGDEADGQHKLPYATDPHIAAQREKGGEHRVGTVMGNTTLEQITSQLSTAKISASKGAPDDEYEDEDWETIMKRLESQEEANFQRKRGKFGILSIAAVSI